MEDNIEKIKSLRIENLPSIIGDLRKETEELNSQLLDLNKVREELEEKAEPVISGFYQMSDVTAKLKENSIIAKKKLDDAVAKGIESQKVNAVFSGQVKEFSNNCEQEEKDILLWVSEWGEKVFDLSKQFLSNSKLYNRDNLAEELAKKVEEYEELRLKVDEIKLNCMKLREQKANLENELTDGNTCSHFLNSSEANYALSLLIDAVEVQKRKRQSLLDEKQELERWVKENDRSN